MKEGKLIKSPLNYTGGKYKLLPQLLPLFPENIDTFVDLFAGGCNVGINVNANRVVMNDIESHVIDFMNNVKELSGQEAIEKVLNVILNYNLSDTNKDGYMKLRQNYNNGNKEWYNFYALLAHSFNNQIRYNKKGEYNMPFGKDRSSFNETLQGRFVKFVDAIDNKHIFTNNDFIDLELNNLSNSDFVYCDPPYLITVASYNEQDGWNEYKEEELYSLLDRLNSSGIKFGLSNVFYHKGKSNDILIKWAERYNVHYLDKDYKNCSYHGKDIDKKTVEVYVCNY